jgi:hypothetical protein
MGVGGRARERIQKGFDRKYNDWGVSVMTEQDIRQRLARQEYPRLAGSPDAPRRSRWPRADRLSPSGPKNMS